MNTRRVLIVTGILFAAIVLTACLPLDPSAALKETAPNIEETVRIESGGEVPFYARFGENEFFSDGELTVVVFYRPPECIPAEFNMNQFFHFPDDSGPGAFGCGPTTTNAIETWQNGPDIDPAPLIAETTGRGAVPVWFAASSEVEEAMADGEMSIADLAGMPSLLMGTAATYTELLHPSQSNEQTLIQFAAKGKLDDGRPFMVDVSKGAADVEDHISIDIDDEAADGEVSGGAAPTVTFTATEYAYEGPTSIPGGLTRIELVNGGEQEHMLWAIKLDEGKSFDDIMGVFATLESDPQMPEWMVWYGGVTAGPGMTSAYTIDLAPGTYSLFSFGEDEEGVPDAMKGMQTSLTVTDAEDNGATPPVADLRTELVDFSYVIHGDPVAGPQLIEVANTGMEAHEAIMLKLGEGVTVEDTLDFMMMAEEEAGGPPPFEFFGGAGPMNAGLTAWYEVDIPAGEYGLICFIPSVANGGAPHFMLGMVAQVTVAEE